MKNILVVSFVLLLCFSFSQNSFGQEKKIEKNIKVDKVDTEIVDTKPVNTVCPVSGEEVDNKITSVYKGKTYALCCKTCLKKFNKDPEKYVSKLSDDGKSLKKNK